MPAPKKYPDEIRERSVRLVLDLVEGEEQVNVTAACTRVGEQLGINRDTLRGLGRTANATTTAPRASRRS